MRQRCKNPGCSYCLEEFGDGEPAWKQERRERVRRYREQRLKVKAWDLMYQNYKGNRWMRWLTELMESYLEVARR